VDHSAIDNFFKEKSRDRESISGERKKIKEWQLSAEVGGRKTEEHIPLTFRPSSYGDGQLLARRWGEEARRTLSET